MSCLQTLAGIARDCSPSMGGVKRVYIANAEDIDTITITSEKISAITLLNSATFKTYEFRPETASLESAWQVNKANGTAYVHSTLTLQFSAMDTAKRIEMNALALGALVAVVEDNNGKYWFIGYDNPVTLDAGDNNGTGTAMADANRYGIVLGDDSLTLPYEVVDGTAFPKS